jgi:hypothetical protein
VCKLIIGHILKGEAFEDQNNGRFNTLITSFIIQMNHFYEELLKSQNEDLLLDELESPP